MSETRIRPATAADLDQVHEIWYQSEVKDFPDPPSRGALPPIFRHEIEAGEMYVAEAGGRIMGYAALVTRGEVAYLAELYVRDDVQSSGLGQTLLAHVLPCQGRTVRSGGPSPEVRSNGFSREVRSHGFSRSVVCTLSSDDPRALALYIRAGMQPRWPHFLLYAAVGCGRPAELSAAGVAAIPARPGDPDLVRWDAEVGGRHRPEDHAFWTEQAGAVPLWFVRGDETIGYGYVQARNHEVALWHPEALSLGPVGARSAADALACTLAAVDWAAERAPALALGVPGAHPSMPVLLAAGFRITYVETFVSTAASFPAEPGRYLPSSSTLF